MCPKKLNPKIKIESVYVESAIDDEKPGTENNRVYIGIIAKAKILVPTDNPGESQLQTITSHGCWGIESDAGDYIQEVAKEQLEELKQQLTELGIGERACDYAIKRWNGEIISK